MENIIQNQTFDEERALYHLTNTRVENCTFAGPADGESALKEAVNVEVVNCRFSLRYPFWHTTGFLAKNCSLDEKTRAPIWYSRGGHIHGCLIESVKCLRECQNMKFEHCTVKSPEFGWRCRNIDIDNCQMHGEYYLFETQKGHIRHLNMTGKYSFQYTEDLLVTDSYLDTKDAFWHSKNCTVHNSTLKGEYLAWYSENLTLVNCHIIGTQPFCYCENLTLVNCTMEETDLSFEYSSVNADIKGNILSVKNPKSGRIEADSYGQVILCDSVVENSCEIVTRQACTKA